MPFRCAVGMIPEQANGSTLHKLFQRLREEADLKPGVAYNMILVAGHMIVIPRRTADIDGIQANAAAMIGVVYCSSQGQYESWVREGPMEMLERFGVPKGSRN